MVDFGPEDFNYRCNKPEEEEEESEVGHDSMICKDFVFAGREGRRRIYYIIYYYLGGGFMIGGTKS
jgi:hypothetical protein